MATRDYRFEKKPVVSHRITQMSWGAAATDAQTEALTVNAVLTEMSVKISAATNAITFTVSLVDEYGGTRYTQSGIAVNGTTVLPTAFGAGMAVNCAGDLTLTVTPSGAPGAGGVTVDIDVLGT